MSAGAPPGGGLTEDAVRGERRLDASDTLLAEIPALEHAPDQPIGRAADDQGAGLGQRLEARGHVRRLPEGEPFPAGPAPDLAPMAWMMPSPARTARCASSSWAAG